MRIEQHLAANGNGRATSARAQALPTTYHLARVDHSLRATQRLGARYWMRTVTMLVGLGSTASRTVCRTVDCVSAEVGFRPNVLGYLCLDADAKFPPRHRYHCFPFDVVGAGTDPTKGLAMFLAKSADIWEVLKSHFATLLTGDPRFPTELSARQALTVHVVAGCGGASGGAEQAFINFLHHVARLFSIQILRVHVHRIGPDVPLADMTRNVSREQVEIVHSTFATNLGQSLTDFSLDDLREVVRYHDGHKLAVPSRLRVTSHSLTTRTNGQVDCLTSSDTEQKLAWALFGRVMTSAGMDHDSHICDEIGYGAPFGFPR
jgi:hypothetical protein